MDKMKLSIIILSWNTGELLKQCLESVISGLFIKELTDYKCRVEIIVVDNASEDGSCEMVKKEFPEVRLIQNKENLGFAKGNNVGLNEAKGEYIMILNSDTIIKEGAIEKLVKFLDTNENAAGVMPLLLNKDNSIQKDPIYLRFPSPLFVFINYNSFFKKIAVNFFSDLLYSVNDFSRVSEVEQLSGAAMIIKGDILKSIGGFDETYPYYFEDVDLSFQLRKLGYKLFMDPEAKIIHLGGQSTKKLIENDGMDKMHYLNFNSLFIFSDKSYSKTKSKMIKFIVLAQLILKGKLKLVRKLLSKN